MNRRKSGRGLPHSKTLSRDSAAPATPPGFGLRQPSGALRFYRILTLRGTDQRPNFLDRNRARFGRPRCQSAARAVAAGSIAFRVSMAAVRTAWLGSVRQALRDGIATLARS